MTRRQDGRYIRFVFDKNRLVGAILLGDVNLMSATKKAVEGKQDCSTLLQRSPTVEAAIEYLFPGKTGTIASWGTSLLVARPDLPVRVRSALPRSTSDGFLRVPRVRLRVRREQGGAEVE